MIKTPAKARIAYLFYASTCLIYRQIVPKSTTRKEKYLSRGTFHTSLIHLHAFQRQNCLVWHSETVQVFGISLSDRNGLAYSCITRSLFAHHMFQTICHGHQFSRGHAQAQVASIVSRFFPVFLQRYIITVLREDSISPIEFTSGFQRNSSLLM